MVLRTYRWPLIASPRLLATGVPIGENHCTVGISSARDADYAVDGSFAVDNSRRRRRTGFADGSRKPSLSVVVAKRSVSQQGSGASRHRMGNLNDYVAAVAM